MKSSRDRRQDIKQRLEDAPDNWGRWGSDDQVGVLNVLTAELVLRSVGAIRSGKVFALQAPIGSPGGDFVHVSRMQPQRFTIVDKASYDAGHAFYPGGFEFAEDALLVNMHGATHMDALGHAWCGDELYNGVSATYSIAGNRWASIQAIAERGIVSRGVLLDVARHRGRECLDPGETVTHDELIGVAEHQGVTIKTGDTLVLRTGCQGAFSRGEKPGYFEDFNEPGLVYSTDLVSWFRENDITGLVTDTIANEVTIDPDTGALGTLHVALLRNLGVPFVEAAQLDELAADCAVDGQYDFLYVAAPMNVVRGSGAPVNPVVVK
jgi:kynurenine formamidase